MPVFSVSFIVFSMFFMLSVKPLCSIVLLPFSAILTNLILFIFHVPNTTVLLLNLFVICLYLCLFNPICGCYVPDGTHTQWWYSIMVCIILLCFTFHPAVLCRKKNSCECIKFSNIANFHAFYVWGKRILSCNDTFFHNFFSFAFAMQVFSTLVTLSNLCN